MMSALVGHARSGVTEVAINVLGVCSALSRPADRNRNVTIDVPAYPPVGKNGSERSIEATARMLVRHGFDVRVVAKFGPGNVTRDGVSIFPDTRKGLAGAYENTSLVLTQLESRPRAALQARLRRVPYALFIRLGLHRGMFGRGKPDLYVFNSAWLQKESGVPLDSSVILHPPIHARDYSTPDGERSFISLVNLSRNKGGELFWELAKRLPEHRFLGVRGYGDQVIPSRLPKNVLLLDRQSDIREVYRKSRIVLVPSEHETFGRVAVEAAASGIPTIAHPSNGLKEVLGTTGMFADRADSQAWASWIQKLDSPVHYANARREASEILGRFNFPREETQLVGCLERLIGSPQA